MNDIVVLGSLNMDLVIETSKMPVIGETISGKTIHYFPGGKGANQAVAAARLGVKTLLIGCLGEDVFGKTLLNNLSGENYLDISGVDIVKGETGIATVFSTEKDNAIIVIPGVNEKVNNDLVDKFSEKIMQAKILLMQFEIPMGTLGYALKTAKRNGVKTIINPAPFAEIPNELFEYIDYITPNESEFLAMIGENEIEDIERAIIKWSQKYKTNLIVTRGSKGVSFFENGEIITIESQVVDVVDTTGAGDTFNGALAVALSKGNRLYDSVKFANIAAGISIQKFGAQSGMPRFNEMPNDSK